MISKDIRTFFSSLKLSNIVGWFNVEYIFVNYFWFYTIFSILFLIIRNESLYNIGFPVVLALLVLKNIKRININIIDFLWICELIWISMTWILNDYPHKFYLMLIGLTRELTFMLAYWIARCSSKDYLKTIIRNARRPLLIGCVFGIYCFLFPPEWYIKRVEDTLLFFNNGDASASLILEQLRLRSFYRSSYAVSYMCSLAIIFESFCFVNHYYNKGSKQKYIYGYVLILIISSLLCMMRAPIFCWLIGLLVVLMYRQRFSTNRKGLFLKLALCVLLLVFIGYNYSQIDSNSFEFFLKKFDIEDKDTFIKGRFLLQSQSFTMFGEGFAKYNMMTFYKFGLPSIPDGEYVKIIAEQGFLGLVILLSMFFFGFIKAALNFKCLFFELFVIFMLLVCMIGADPLSIPDKHCFIYWLALGQVSRYKSPRLNILSQYLTVCAFNRLKIKMLHW